MYDEGKGVRANARKAVRLYRLAARHGYVFAHTQLGGMYLYGDGMAQNFGKALKHYQMAADQSERIAAYFLGVLYYEGRPTGLHDLGVPHQAALGLAWFRKAADWGCLPAESKLEYLRARGIS